MRRTALYHDLKNRLLALNLNGRWNTVVGTRGGKPVIHWPGVLNLAGLVVAASGLVLLLGQAGGSVLWSYVVSGYIAVLGFGVLVGRIPVESRRPPDQLPPPLDDQP
jgi:hypothetical protein